MSAQTRLTTPGSLNGDNRSHFIFDASRYTGILFQVSELLIYISFVLLGQSFHTNANGAVIYIKAPEWVPPPNWTPPLPDPSADPKPLPYLPTPTPDWMPVVDGVDPFTLKPLTDQIFETYTSSDRPEAVSGLYGPGAYVSWILVLLSSIVATFVSPPHEPDQHRVRIDADILATNIYAIVASVDLLHRHYLSFLSRLGASIAASERIVWNALIFSLAIIGPNRGGTLNNRLKLQYIALWIFTVSEIQTRTPSFPDLGVMYRSNMWKSLPMGLLLSLRHAATTTAPLAIYYRWSAAIPSRLFKLLAAVVFFFCFTYGQILFHNYWLFLPISVDGIVTWRFRVLLPPARSDLRDLDQLAPLITSAFILLWQWKLWKLGLGAIRLAQKLTLKLLSRRRPTIEEPHIDLEDIPASATNTEV